MSNLQFVKATNAFDYFYREIMKQGEVVGNTKVLRNIGFTLLNPLERSIDNEYRKWNPNYAEAEWEWYLSGNRNADEIAKRAPIWKQMQDEDGNVNSNYGWQWMRSNQLDNVITLLRNNPNTRQASISIYDGKEIFMYNTDTPCTYAVNFYYDKLNRLCMSVLMRSNDLVLGFCNDQYCFSKLQEMVAKELNAKVGTYYHFAQNLHIYETHYDLIPL